MATEDYQQNGDGKIHASHTLRYIALIRSTGKSNHQGLARNPPDLLQGTHLRLKPSVHRLSGDAVLNVRRRRKVLKTDLAVKSEDN